MPMPRFMHGSRWLCRSVWIARVSPGSMGGDGQKLTPVRDADLASEKCRPAKAIDFVLTTIHGIRRRSLADLIQFTSCYDLIL